MRMMLKTLGIFIFGVGILLATNLSAQDQKSLPPQIDSQAHFVAWIDVDRVSIEEFLKWAQQTELSPLFQGMQDPETITPVKLIWDKLRAAGGKRVFLTVAANGLLGDPSALGLVIRCDQPERCAAALEADPLILDHPLISELVPGPPLIPGQFLQPTEGAVLLAISPEGLEALREVNGQPSAELSAALASTEDAVGVAVALPATAMSLLAQSAPRDGSPMSAAVDRLIKLKWARASGSPSNSKLKLEARFDAAESAAEFARQVNLVCESMFDGGEKAELLVADQERVQLSELSAKSIAGMAATARASAREAQDMNTVRQLLLAMHNFHDATGALPPQALTDKAGKRLLSWRVLLLPFLQEQELYNQFHLDEAWDSPHNLALLEKMPSCYRSVGTQDDGEIKPGYTRFVAPLTANSIMGKAGRPTRLQDIADGTSNTILLLQATPSAAVPWTKPDDLLVNEANPREGMVAAGQASLIVGLANGSIQELPTDIAPQQLKAMITQDGGDQ